MKHIPNLLTGVRLFIIPLFVILFFFDTPFVHWVTFVLYFFVSMTDFFDGYVARRFAIVSPLGVMLDPIADKIFVMCTLLALMVRDQAIIYYIFIPTLIIVSREFLVAGLREFLSGLDVSLKVTFIAKWKTAVQFVALGTLILGYVIPYGQLLGLFFLWVATILTLFTGFDYVKKAWKRI